MQGVEEVADRPVPSQRDFLLNELIFALRVGLLYVAKVISVEREEGQRATAYTVHFQGWRKAWHEKIRADQCFEHNLVNLRIAHKLLNNALKLRQARQPANVENETPGNQDSAAPSSWANDLFRLPPLLRRQLVEDWEFIERGRKLVPLPRRFNVQGILQTWSHGRTTDQATKDVAYGLKSYFDAALPKMLLYRFEREQYNTVFRAGSSSGSPLSPSAVYGAEHLLRLLVKLPSLLEGAHATKESMEKIAEKVNEFAHFIQEKGRILFQTAYLPASQEYINKVNQA